MTDKEIEARLKRLEDFVLVMFEQMALEFRLIGDYNRGRLLSDMVHRFRSSIKSAIIHVPEDMEDIKFYKVVGKGTNKKRVARGVHVLEPRVAGLLMGAGYESLRDLNGISTGEICAINGFGPAAIRNFMRFLLGILPDLYPERKTDK